MYIKITNIESYCQKLLMMHGIKTQNRAAVEILSYNGIPFCCPEKRVVEFDITKYHIVKILKYMLFIVQE